MIDSNWIAWLLFFFFCPWTQFLCLLTFFLALPLPILWAMLPLGLKIGVGWVRLNKIGLICVEVKPWAETTHLSCTQSYGLFFYNNGGIMIVLLFQCYLSLFKVSLDKHWVVRFWDWLLLLGRLEYCNATLLSSVCFGFFYVPECCSLMRSL